MKKSELMKYFVEILNLEYEREELVKYNDRLRNFANLSKGSILYSYRNNYDRSVLDLPLTRKNIILDALIFLIFSAIIWFVLTMVTTVILTKVGGVFNATNFFLNLLFGLLGLIFVIVAIFIVYIAPVICIIMTIVKMFRFKKNYPDLVYLEFVREHFSPGYKKRKKNFYNEFDEKSAKYVESIVEEQNVARKVIDENDGNLIQLHNKLEKLYSRKKNGYLILHPTYADKSVVALFYDYLDKGRCDNLKECINLFEQEITFKNIEDQFYALIDENSNLKNILQEQNGEIDRLKSNCYDILSKFNEVQSNLNDVRNEARRAKSTAYFAFLSR